MSFKIVEKRNRKIRFIYHGVNKKKDIEKGVWLEAAQKMVRDGSSYTYLSGFHFFETKAIARKYLKRFKNQENKVIVPVEVRDVRSKGPNTEVLLASKIKF